MIYTHVLNKPVISIKSPETPDEKIVQIMRAKLANRGTEKEPKISERTQSALSEMKNAHIYTHRLLNQASEDNFEEWGNLGTRNGVNGDRQINSVDDLAKNAKWLVKTFVSIVQGEIPPMPYDGSYLSP